MRVPLYLAWLGLAPAVLGQAPEPPYEELVHHFDYNRKAPLDVRETKVHDRSGVKIHELSYASSGGRVPALLVTPPGHGPFAVILYGHWIFSGSPMSNKSEFLDEAVVMARAGAMSLLIDAPAARPGYVQNQDGIGGAEQESRLAAQEVIDMRRGLDMMLARPGADPKRVAYVGHSLGAHVGAILAGVDRRFQSFVLMAGGYADRENTMKSVNPQVLAVRRQLGEERVRKYFQDYTWDDPVHYIGHSSPAAVFLQFAKLDAPEAVGRKAYDRFGDPKRIAFYEASHSMNVPATKDRVVWLIRRLDLKPVTPAMLTAILPVR